MAVASQLNPSPTATLREVAAQAGVSVATASRVVNRGNASADACNRVNKAIEELGYKPNCAARQLVTRQTQTLVGVVVEGGLAPRLAAFIEAVETACGDRRQSMIVRRAPVSEAIASVVAPLVELVGVQGLIVVGSCSHVDLEQARAARIPVVLIDVAAKNVAGEIAGVGHVDSGLSEGACLVADHMQTLGHRHLAYLCDGSIASRVLGQAFSARIDDLRLPALSVVAQDAAQSARPPFCLAQRITAVFAANDLIAVAARQHLRHESRQERCVVGFGDSELASVVDPPLTSVRLDMPRVARQAVSLLGRLPNSPRTSDLAVEIPPTLHVRASSGEGLDATDFRASAAERATGPQPALRRNT